MSFQQTKDLTRKFQQLVFTFIINMWIQLNLLNQISGEFIPYAKFQLKVKSY